MMKIKKKLSNIVDKYKSLSILHAVYLFIFRPSRITFVKYPSFQGWGMTTITRTPWGDGGGHAITESFSKVDARLKSLVKDKKFILSQFQKMFPGIDEIKFLNELNWRHYIVYWSSTYAIKNTQVVHKNLAECGVCDGLTIFYAINAAKALNKSYSAYLYDAWDAMKEDLLMESEKDFAGEYAYLDMKATQKNLSMFETKDIFFNKGYIPDSFKVGRNPDSLVWLHVDLNSAVPTLHALNFFWDSLEMGGVILFDDYALPGYQDTQKAVETWIKSKNGTLLHLPTGQAIIIKDKYARSV